LQRASARGTEASFLLQRASPKFFRSSDLL
jgi:hypothetical protein